MSKEITDVTIIGGGDSGLLTALAIERFNSSLDVSVVDDFERDVPQVGKSTFLAIFNILHDSLGIDEERFVQEVRPVWKTSVYFRDWCGYEPFHYPFDVASKFPAPDTPDAIEEYYYYYDECYDSPDHRTKCEAIVEQETSPWYYDVAEGETRKYNNVAYHLNTERFNGFLRDRCRERGVSLINDEIVDVDVDGARIERVRSKSQTYESDLYVDASGFNRVIKGELDDAFTDFDFPLDSAFNARLDRPLEDVVSATVIETGDHGWFWQIDTYDNRDVGYVFASEFVSDDEALAEFLDFCSDVATADGDSADAAAGDDLTADDVAKYTFSSGYYDRAWRENCVAIGNAEGFVEPLQSTGLTVNAQAAVNLSNLLAGHGRINDETVRDTYNAWVRRSWESIFDFVGVHYRCARGDTEFWETMQSIDLGPRVERLFEAFDRNGFDTNIDPITNDGEFEEFVVFRTRNFFTLMRNMGATSAFYESNDFAVSDAVRRERDEYYRSIAEDVEGHYTTKELYKGILSL